MPKRPKQPTKTASRREIALPPNDYQPSRGELREEFDMPGASMKRIREALLRPVDVRRKPRKK